MIFGSKVYRAASVRNTLQWARENLAQAPDGAVFLADHVEQAQGRQGRSWQIAPGQLLFTAVLKPSTLAHYAADDLPIKLNQLSLALSLGILEPIKQYGVGIKWPNDFVVQEKKVCGMLMQGVWEGGKIQGLIFGFGLNINNTFSSENELFDVATSLKNIVGSDLPMRELYKQLLLTLDRWYLVWQEEKFAEIYKTWKQEQVFLHKKIGVHQKDGTVISGKLSQVLPNGDAVVMTDTMHLKTVQFHNVEAVRGN